MKTNSNETKKQFFLNQAKQSKSNIQIQILKLCQELPENQTNISKKDIKGLLENIWNIIKSEINKLCDNLWKAEEIINKNKFHKKIDYKIENNSELNHFTSKDIQDENKEITRKFQSEANNYMAIDEQKENEKVAIFCKNVAQISRISYKASFKLLKTMEDKFIKSNKNKISSTDENFRKEFSFWIKCSEIENNIFQEYKNILNREIPFQIDENSNNEKYLLILFYDLSLLYFHCHIAFPLVEIDFKIEEKFNSSKMIDFINRGKNRMVNFVILPSLFSNGLFLENGKSWVFTYLKDTFRFEENEILELNNILFTQSSNTDNKENYLTIKVILKNKKEGKCVDIITNFDIPKNKRYEFAVIVCDKNEDKTYSLITKLAHLEIGQNMEVVKCELRIDNKIVISSKNIIVKD